MALIIIPRNYRTKRKITNPVGLGDSIANIAYATGLEKVAAVYEKKTGRPCNCARRQATLNRWVPYRKR